jgi:trehalose-phosphatase
VILPLGSAREEFARLATAARPVLFLDLDGTLSPLVDWPREKSRVPPVTRRTLQALRVTGAEVIIVSGRGVDGVMEVLRAPVDAVIGNHGADLLEGAMRRRWLHGNPRKLRRAALMLEEEFRPWPRTWVQVKPYSVAVHWRGSLGQGRRVWDRTVELLAGWGLEAHTGRRVIDVRLPRVNKGRAVLAWLEAREPRALSRGIVCYAGDDTTDEYAFSALAGRGMTIVVGKRARGAAFRTSSVASFTGWLAKLARARKERGLRQRTED